MQYFIQATFSKARALVTRRSVFGFAVLLGLSGCQMIKPAPRPQIAIGLQISSPSQYGLDMKDWETQDWKIAQPSAHLPKGEWWQIFQDAQLNQLLTQLNQGNATIAQYEAQYRQALSMIDQAKAARLPSVAANTSMTRGKAQQAGTLLTTNQYELSSMASWESDLWGKIRQNILVNQSQAKAREAELNNMRLSMQAQLVSRYLQWVLQTFELQSEKENIDNLKRVLSMTQNQYQAGIVASTTVDQAQSQYHTALASYSDLQLSQIQLQHAIAMLIGQPQDQFQLKALTQLPTLPQLPANIPSRVLQQRPDVAAAAENMAAANAQVGVARLAFFPDFNLVGSIGYQSSLWRQLFNAPNLIWSLGPSLAATLFDGGRRHAQTEQAKAAYDASAAAYKQTVLAAIQNVEDNIAAQYLLSREAKQQQAALDAAIRAEKTTMNQYKAGIVAYLNVLTAQNTRISAQNAVWTIRNRQYQTTVSLVTAMGGKWD